MGLPNLAGERVLITGGAGAIGSNIADQLVQAGRRRWWCWTTSCAAAARTSNGRSPTGRYDWSRATSATASSSRELTRGMDVVFHQAALRITQCAEEPRLGARGDGRWHIQRDRGSARRGRSQGRGRVLGVRLRPRRNVPHRRAPPPLRNDTLYGAAKTFNEGLLRSFHAMQGLDYVALRYFNVYGPRMDIHGVYTEVLVRWMERIEAGGSPLILGDGSQTMDFVYIEDIARANLLAATTDSSDDRLQRRQRHRDQPARARRAADRGDGRGRSRRIRPRARRQQGAAPARGHEAGARAARLRSRSRSRGGPSTARRLVARRARPGRRPGGRSGLTDPLRVLVVRARKASRIFRFGHKVARVPAVVCVVATHALDERSPAQVGGLKAVSIEMPTRNGRLLDASCRALDIVGSAILLVVLAPLLGLVALP